VHLFRFYHFVCFSGLASSILFSCLLLLCWVSSVLCQEIGYEEHLQNNVFCGDRTQTRSIDECIGNYTTNMKPVHWPLMGGCCIWYS